MASNKGKEVAEYDGPTTNMKIPTDLAEAIKDMADEQDVYGYTLFDRLFRKEIETRYASFLERRKKRDDERLRKLKGEG